MAQSAKRIEQLAPELEKIVSAAEPIHDLADGFGGAHGPAEGPLWWREGGYLVFSDIHNNKRMKYEPGLASWANERGSDERNAAAALLRRRRREIRLEW